MIGAGEFLGTHVARALAAEVPVIELNADADQETLDDAIAGVEIVVFCAQTVSPGRRLSYRKRPPASLQRVVEAARKARVRRIVQVSTADMLAPNQFMRVTETSPVRSAHAFERIKLFEEEWLLGAAADVEVVILRAGRVFGEGEDWLLPRLMANATRGRVWLPGGGRAGQTFVSAKDVGRACLAASDRGRPGTRYLVGGFDSTWRELVHSAARAAGFLAEIGSVPYDLAYLRALAVESITSPGAAVWPGLYAVDVLGKPHLLDDSWSRRELTWSPSIGSFGQLMPAMTGWLTGLPEVSAALAAEATSPPGR